MDSSKFEKFSPLVIRIGLGLVFLANSYAAFHSSEFVELMGNSFLASLSPAAIQSFVFFIGVSDGIVAILFLLGIFSEYAAIYSLIWLLGVMAVIGSTGDLSGVLEHAGFFAMAFYLIFNKTHCLS